MKDIPKTSFSSRKADTLQTSKRLAKSSHEKRLSSFLEGEITKLHEKNN